MRDRFTSARLLIEDAKVSLARLENEHLPKAAAAGAITDDCILEGAKVVNALRTALERCARELYERHKTGTKSRHVYFPIVPMGLPVPKKKTFAKWVNENRIPGLNDRRPDLVKLLESFQPFTNPMRRSWLGILAGLHDTHKHNLDEPGLILHVTHTVVAGAAHFFTGSPDQTLEMTNIPTSQGLIRKLRMKGSDIIECDCDPEVTVTMCWFSRKWTDPGRANVKGERLIAVVL